MSELPAHEPLAVVRRGGRVESVHAGSVVVLDPHGAVLLTIGDPCVPMYPRSTMKPLQAAAMVGCGLSLPSELVALAAASHSGQRRHVDGVRQILATAGLGVEDLGNPAGMPLDPAVRDEWVAAGHRPAPIAHNCSGKHAAMLATCVANGWPVDGYRRPQHPLQQAIAATVRRLCGEEIAHTAVDGCTAPLFAVSLQGVARATAALATAPAGTPEGVVAEAIRRHPDMLGGTARPVTQLIEAVPGLIAKDGAEGVEVAATADGAAVAVKIADGARRPLAAVIAAGLVRCGVPAATLTPFLAGADTEPDDGVALLAGVLSRTNPARDPDAT